MSASDNLNQNQFRLFHGTNAKKIKGDTINPTKQRGDEWDGDGPRAAFASSHLDDAANYGEHVYEVHPQSYMENYGSGVFASDSGFDVKRKIKPEVVDRYSRIYGPIREQQERIAHGKLMHEMGSESWSHEGANGIFHVRYDEGGNPIKTKVERAGDRPKETKQ
jgi:hypothetical protein